MHRDSDHRVIRSSSEERIERLKKVLRSLATRIPVIELKRIEEQYPSLQYNRTVSVINSSSHQDIKSRKSRFFKCPKCRSTYDQEYAFNNHVCKIFICNICKRTFTLNRSLKRHMSKHITDRPSSCDLCGKRFRCARDTHQHFVMAHGKRKQCEMCGKVFMNNGRFLRHLGVDHAGMKQHVNIQIDREVHNSMNMSDIREGVVYEKPMKNEKSIEWNSQQQYQTDENRPVHKVSYETIFNEFVEKVIEESFEKRSEQKNQDFEESSEEKNQDLEKRSEEKNQDFEKSSEEKNQDFEKSSEEKNQDFVKSSEEKNQDFEKSLEEKNQDFEKSLEEKNQDFEKSSEEKNQDLEKSSEEKNQDFEKSSEEKNQDFEKSLEEKNQDFEKSSEEKNQDFEKSSEEKNQDFEEESFEQNKYGEKDSEESSEGSISSKQEDRVEKCTDESEDDKVVENLEKESELILKNFELHHLIIEKELRKPTQSGYSSEKFNSVPGQVLISDLDIQESKMKFVQNELDNPKNSELVEHFP